MRRKKLLDKSFQLRTVFSVIGFVFIMNILILGLTGVNLYFNTTKLNDVLKSQHEVVNTLKEVNKALEYFAFNKNWDSLILSNGQISKDLAVNIEMIEKNDNSIRNLTNTSKYILIVMILLVLLQGFMLFSSMLTRTHRIYGPIFIMKRHMDSIMNKEKPNIRPLRDKDEFKEFYHTFCELVKFIENKEATIAELQKELDMKEKKIAELQNNTGNGSGIGSSSFSGLNINKKPLT